MDEAVIEGKWTCVTPPMVTGKSDWKGRAMGGTDEQIRESW